MMTYEYDQASNIIHLRASGVVVKDDPIAYFKELSDDRTFKPKAEERIYFSGVEDIAFTYKDVQEISDAFDHYKHGDKISNGVFIVDNDFSFGMARMVVSIFGPIFSEFTIEQV